MKNKFKSKVIIPHSDNCFMKGKRNPWSGCIDEADPYLSGNYRANPDVKKGRGHLWIRVTCNDPKCPGRKAVHISVLAKA